MTVTIPDAVVDQADCTPAELVAGLFVGLFVEGRLTMGQAAAAMELSRFEFMEHLSELGLSMPYSSADAEADLEVVDRLWPTDKEPVLP